MGGGGGVLLDGCHTLTLFGWIRTGVAGLWFDQGWTLRVSVHGRVTCHVVDTAGVCAGQSNLSCSGHCGCLCRAE